MLAFTLHALCLLLTCALSLGPRRATAAPLSISLADLISAPSSRGTPLQISAFLDAHNTLRAAHNASALAWSPTLAARAALWADQCEFRHTDGVLSTQRYGENIVAGTGEFPIDAAVASFVGDEDQYDPAHPSYLLFTQVVWKSTTQLGCAVSSCEGIFDRSLGRAALYVCLYNPVGNVIGQAPENVQVY